MQTDPRRVAPLLPSTSTRWMAILGVLLLAFLSAQPVAAQQPDIPRNEDAELMFEQGLAAFERGDYNRAYQRFRLVNDYSLNRKTTAALLMAGKSLYRLERYQEAVSLLQTLKQRYPESTYADDADEVLASAREALARFGNRPDTLRIGVALPLDDQNATLSQALFNGVRLAVDRHNGVQRRYVLPVELQDADTLDVFDTAEVFGDSLAEADGQTTLATPTDTMQVDSIRVVTEQVERPRWIAKMYFRDVTGDPEAAIDSLVQIDEVDVVIGPLFSSTARRAGAAAERNRVLMVAPLATEESVSEGREYVFQANPTISLRGRLMATFAARSLLVKSAGIIFEKNTGSDIGQRMARAFQEEAERRGIEVTYTLGLDNPRSWSRLPTAIAADSTITDSLIAVSDAVYLPFSGRNAQGKIQDALTGLGRLRTQARVLGNAEWHNLAIEQEASKFLATYTNDFYVQTRRPEVQRFIRDYRLLTAETPDDLAATEQRLAYAGYDVTTFLMQALRPSASRPGPSVLRNADAYDGLGVRIDFAGGNVNGAMFYHRYRNNRIELLQ